LNDAQSLALSSGVREAGHQVTKLALNFIVPRFERQNSGKHRMAFPPPTERQARLIWTALTGLAIATLVTLVWRWCRDLAACCMLSPVLWPVAVAGVLACLLDPVVDFSPQESARTRALYSFSYWRC
jgi:hypothetical protein